MTKHVLHYKSTFTDYKSYELLPINSQREWDQLALNEWSYRRTEAGGYEGWGIWSEVKEVEE